MEIAILGAGMAGLSCAIMLEKQGITPTIFEKRACPGDRFVNAESMFSILNRPVRDCISYLDENYGIRLKPISEVDKLVLHSKNKTSSIDGKIGYTNIRGRQKDSFENQLARQVKTPIRYHSTMEYEQALREFDYVVLATGDGAYASKLNNYRCDLTCSLKGALVEGQFDQTTPHVWFNYGLIPKGYAWLVPYSNKEANLVFAYPDTPENELLDIEKVWERFYALASREFEQSFRITDQFQIRRYIMGICERPKVNKTYFTGNCFGALSPGLGFGQFASILTGVFAAYDLCGLGDYGTLTQPLFENYNHSIALRRYLEDLNDKQFDLLVGSINVKMIDALATRIFNTGSSFDLLKWITPFLS